MLNLTLESWKYWCFINDRLSDWRRRRRRRRKAIVRSAPDGSDNHFEHLTCFFNEIAMLRPWNFNWLLPAVQIDRDKIADLVWLLLPSFRMEESACKAKKITSSQDSKLTTTNQLKCPQRFGFSKKNLLCLFCILEYSEHVIFFHEKFQFLVGMMIVRAQYPHDLIYS